MRGSVRRGRHRGLVSSDSLPKWLPWPGPDQAEAMSLELLLGLSLGVQEAGLEMELPRLEPAAEWGAGATGDILTCYTTPQHWHHIFALLG